jgi:hypothetical protein
MPSCKLCGNRSTERTVDGIRVSFCITCIEKAFPQLRRVTFESGCLRCFLSLADYAAVLDGRIPSNVEAVSMSDHSGLCKAG